VLVCVGLLLLFSCVKLPPEAMVALFMRRETCRQHLFAYRHDETLLYMRVLYRILDQAVKARCCAS
jgi:hypothetical protein